MAGNAASLVVLAQRLCGVARTEGFRRSSGLFLARSKADLEGSLALMYLQVNDEQVLVEPEKVQLPRQVVAVACNMHLIVCCLQVVGLVLVALLVSDVPSVSVQADN